MEKTTDRPAPRWRIAFRAGGRKGLSGYLFILKILVPISFLTMCLEKSGLLVSLDGVLGPVTGFLGMGPAAALPLIIGITTGIYGAVAAMMVLPLSQNEITLIAMFLLIAHALIQESIIQQQSGYPAWLAAGQRLAAAIATVLIARPFLPPDAVRAPLSAGIESGFMTALQYWGEQTLVLSVQIFGIIMCVMIVIELLKAFGLIHRILKICGPLLWIMGLSRRTGMLWLAAVLFGITYGGAVIVEEARETVYERDELNRLHFSIGINHAVIEDPCLFLPLGIGVFWLWIPRLIVAVLAVQALKLWYRVRAKRSPGPDQTPQTAGGWSGG